MSDLRKILKVLKHFGLKYEIERRPEEKYANPMFEPDPAHIALLIYATEGVAEFRFTPGKKFTGLSIYEEQ